VGSGAGKFIALGLILVVGLAIAGLITGAIGAGLTQSDEDAATGKTAEGPFIPKPEVHLPAQVAFPTEDRIHYRNFLFAEEVEEILENATITDHDTEMLSRLMHEITGENAELGHGGDLLSHEQHEIIEKLVDEGPYQGSNFIITNALLSSWIASIFLVGLFILGARKAALVPGRFQNFVEIAVEGLLNFVTGTVGREHSRLIFPVIATIFLFVLVNAWIGLLPIYPSLGFKDGDIIQIHLLRPAGTDMNMPLALALVSFVFVEWLGFKMLGMTYITKFFRIGSLKLGIIALFRFQILDAFQYLLDFFFVGPLEGFSELVRLISFTFRLFGNMTAGEILVLVSAFLVPFIATVGVYGLELLVGFIQALIFSGLTLVFAAIAITSHHAEEAH
jgi:F-type H+-transporting ATPase subunit a|tara:strand:+ start:3960 stop:5132 length:1173 start_codon:yes stop_codon:yes gene_type:complete